jgi:hypothetical protein
MRFVVDEVVLDEVFFDYFGFSCQFSFHGRVYSHLSSRAVAGAPSSRQKRRVFALPKRPYRSCATVYKTS